MFKITSYIFLTQSITYFLDKIFGVPAEKKQFLFMPLFLVEPIPLISFIVFTILFTKICKRSGVMNVRISFIVYLLSMVLSLFTVGMYLGIYHNSTIGGQLNAFYISKSFSMIDIEIILVFAITQLIVLGIFTYLNETNIYKIKKEIVIIILFIFVVSIVILPILRIESTSYTLYDHKEFQILYPKEWTVNLDDWRKKSDVLSYGDGIMFFYDYSTFLLIQKFN